MYGLVGAAANASAPRLHHQYRPTRCSPSPGADARRAAGLEERGTACGRGLRPSATCRWSLGPRHRPGRRRLGSALGGGAAVRPQQSASAVRPDRASPATLSTGLPALPGCRHGRATIGRRPPESRATRAICRLRPSGRATMVPGGGNPCRCATGPSRSAPREAAAARRLVALRGRAARDPAADRTAGHSALDMARGLLSEFRSLRGLLTGRAGSGLRRARLGAAKYALLQASLELSRRHYAELMQMGPALAQPARHPRVPARPAARTATTRSSAACSSTTATA